MIGSIKKIITIISLFLLWEILSFLLGQDRFPHILKIIDTFFNSFTFNAIIDAQGGGSNGIYPHIITTFINCNIGLFLGAILGLTVGIILFEFESIREYTSIMIEFLRVIPPLIIIPILLLLFGANLITQIITVATYVGYSMFIYTINALSNIKPTYINLSKLFNISKIKKVVKIDLPASVPELIGGLRVTAAIAFGVIVVTEYLGSPTGLGRVIKFAMSYTDITLIFVCIIWVIILAIIDDIIIIYTTKYFIKWTETTEILKIKLFFI